MLGGALEDVGKRVRGQRRSVDSGESVRANDRVEAAPYRDAPAVTQAQQLAAIGRRRREATGVDPHAAVGERPVSDVRSTVLDLVTDIDVSTVGTPVLLGASMIGLLALFVAAVMFVVTVAVVTGRPLLVPMMLAAVFVAIGYGVSRHRNGPRQWLARRVLRVDGYLELVGREDHVERVLARLEFERRPPEVQFVRDLLAGAGCETAGVDERSPGVIVIHGPEVAGEAKRLHGWFQSLTDRALVPLHETHPVALVTIEER